MHKKLLGSLILLLFCLSCAGDDSKDDSSGNSGEICFDLEENESPQDGVTCVQTSNATVINIEERRDSPLLKNEVVATCKTSELVYNRKERNCGPASTAIDYKCTREGILAAFSDTPGGITAALDQALSESEAFSIDQCGALPTGEPWVSLIRIERTISGEQLRVKTISQESL